MAQIFEDGQNFAYPLRLLDQLGHFLGMLAKRGREALNDAHVVVQLLELLSLLHALPQLALVAVSLVLLLIHEVELGLADVCRERADTVESQVEVLAEGFKDFRDVARYVLESVASKRVDLVEDALVVQVDVARQLVLSVVDRL